MQGNILLIHWFFAVHVWVTARKGSKTAGILKLSIWFGLTIGRYWIFSLFSAWSLANEPIIFTNADRMNK
jgi:hypothetical protein